MTYSGVVATILSGLEPSVALALACVPFLRPYFGRGFGELKSSYNAGNGSKSLKENRSGDSRTFQELRDDASDVQLRPMNDGVQDTHVSAKGTSNRITGSNDQTHITVQKQWEVKSDADS